MGNTIIKTDSSGWENVNSYLYYKKMNGMVYIQGVSSGNVTLYANSWGNIGTLPESFRPSVEVNFTGMLRGTVQPCWCQVTPAGLVRIFNDTTTAQNYWEYGTTFPIG